MVSDLRAQIVGHELDDEYHTIYSRDSSFERISMAWATLSMSRLTGNVSSRQSAADSMPRRDFLMRKNRTFLVFKSVLFGVIAYKAFQLARKLKSTGGRGLNGRSGKVVEAVIKPELHAAEYDVSGKKMRGNGFTMFGVALGSVVAMIVGAFFYFGFQKPVEVLIDYFAYVFPILGGIVGGVGIYFERVGWVAGAKGASKVNSICYQVSILMLFMGLVSYLSIKVGFLGVLWIFFGFVGSVMCSALVIVSNKKMISGPTVTDKRFRPVALALLVLSVVVSVMWLYALSTQSIEEFKGVVQSIWSRF